MSHEFKRNDRVSGLLRRELATLIWSGVKDPRLGSVSVTDVEVTRDLGMAKVYITSVDSESIPDSLKALRSAAGYLRRELGQNLRMRHVPELRFYHDESIERGERIEELLREAGVTGKSEEEE